MLLFIRPLIYMNDDWITANQVYQLDIHHQILYAEGKYGFFENNTPKAYFKAKGNLLPYTSYLPIMSYPTVYLGKHFGESISFIVSIFWSLLLILFSLLLRDIQIENKNFQFLIRLLIPFSFTVFFANLILYERVPFNVQYSQYEVLGVVFYHIIICSLLVGIIFLLCKLIFKDFYYSLFGTIVCFSCSSYLFWTTTLKDHIDCVFLLALIIYSVLLFQKTNDIWYIPTSFILSGLLSWIRPEFGIFILGTVFFLYFITLLKYKYTNKNFYQKFILNISPIFAIIGFIPLLIGNYLTTGNPLILAWQIKPPSITKPSEIPSETTLSTIINHYLYRLTPNTNTPLQDIYGIFLNPATLKLPLFAITPFFVLSILLLPITRYYLNIQLDKNEKKTILTLILFVIITIIAYTTSLTGLSNSMGVYPDIRYLSPTYLPLTIIGLIIFQKIQVIKIDIKKFLKFYLISFSIGILLMLGFLTQYHNKLFFWDVFLLLNGTTSIFIYLLITVTFLSLNLKFFNYIKGNYLYIPISILTALPCIWQVSLLLLCNFYSYLFSGYPPLLPIINYFFNSLYSLN